MIRAMTNYRRRRRRRRWLSAPINRLHVKNSQRQARMWEICAVGDFIIETITAVRTSDTFNPAWIRRVNLRLIVTRIHYVI